MLPLATDEGKVTKDFLQNLLEILFDHIKLQLNRNEKVMHFRNPTDLLENKGDDFVYLCISNKKGLKKFFFNIP